MNLVYLNGTILPAEEARISLFDRGFLYGDGIFETVRVEAGRLFRWADHLARLQQGLDVIGIVLPVETPALASVAAELMVANGCRDGVLRITISRGPGIRGYSPRGSGPTTLALSLHPRLEPIQATHVIVSTIRLFAGDVLATIKTANKLRQVLARAEADAAGADDALLLSPGGEVVEATGSAVFWVEGGRILTPPWNCGLLPGVARGALLELAPRTGMPIAELSGTVPDLLRADGVFLANVVSGPVEVLAIGDHALRRWPRFPELRDTFERMVREE